MPHKIKLKGSVSVKAQRPLAAPRCMCEPSAGVSRTSRAADVRRRRLSEGAWLCSAAAEKYDMGLSERERERVRQTAA